MNGFISIIAIKNLFVINCLNLEIIRISQTELQTRNGILELSLAEAWC